MSQNKTIIPESEYDRQFPSYLGMESSASDFYRPSGAAVSSTVIAGSENPSNIPQTPLPEITGARTGAIVSTSRTIPIQERVVIGVLFSISKGLLGEIFPLYLGRNMLGSSDECDVCLKEGTVSAEHAVVFARSDGYPGECYLSVTDYGSTHGTMINHRDCRYETSPLNDGDTLTIGKHYRFVVRLFDVKGSGLHEDSEFEEMHSGPDLSTLSQQAPMDFYAPTRNNDNDNRTVIG